MGIGTWQRAGQARPRREPGRLLTAACCLLLAAGCGGGADLPDRAKVEGLVTLDGKPLETGTVIFEPDASKGTTGPPAYGQIDPQGRYELRTDRTAASADGAVIGFHRIRIQARQDVEPGELARSLVPARYDDAKRSGLVAEVKPGQVNEVDLPLKSGP